MFEALTMFRMDPKINTEIAAGGAIYIGWQMAIDWGWTPTGHITEKVSRHEISAAPDNDSGK